MFGGVSPEHEVSLSSAYSVLTNIDKEKYNITRVGITKDGKWLLFEGDDSHIKSGEWSLYSNKSAILSPCRDRRLYVIEDGAIVEQKNIDVIFPVMHGSFSEDGTLQGLFELSGIPFVGPGCLSSAVSMDKAMTKLILKNYGIPQAKGLLISKRELYDSYPQIAKVALLFSYPVFVKPSAGGSSIGASKVNDESELLPALKAAFEVCDRVLLEEYINGREIEVAVMGNSNPVSSVCGEIKPGSDFYDYDTKYINDTATLHIPAELSEETSQKIRLMATKIYNALNCKGLARVDFFVDGDTVRFNEINTIPGFTDISMFPKLFIHSGVAYSSLIDRLIDLALE